jgi:riboflavin synthase
MFTGIVQGTARVATVDRQDKFSGLEVAFPEGRAAGIAIGASVALNGTCLTVTRIEGDKLCFDVMMETLRATNLGGLQVRRPPSSLTACSCTVTAWQPFSTRK